MCSLRERTRPAYSGTSAGSAPSAATTTWRARTLPRSVATGPSAGAGTGPRTGAALADARAGLLGRAGQQPVPARGVEGAVVVGQAGHETAALQRGRQVLALDRLAGEAVLLKGARVFAHVLGLLLGHRQPQQPDLSEQRRRRPARRPARRCPAAHRACARTSHEPAPPRTARARRCGRRRCLRSGSRRFARSRPPATVPASRSTVSMPSCASRRAQESPPTPPPITHASTSTSPSSGLLGS